VRTGCCGFHILDAKETVEFQSAISVKTWMADGV